MTFVLQLIQPLIFPQLCSVSGGGFRNAKYQNRMQYKPYVFLLLHFIVLNTFQWTALSAKFKSLNRSSDTSTKVQRSVADVQPQIQGSVGGNPSSANVLSIDKGQQPLGQSSTAFALATGQATNTVAAQPAVQPATLTVKPPPAGQILTSIPQVIGQSPGLARQSAGVGQAGREDLEEDPEVDHQAVDDERDCEDLDPEYVDACRRHRRRRLLRRLRGRRPYRRQRHRFRGRRPRLRPLNDDFGEYDREDEKLNDWLDFKGDPGYYEDNGQGGNQGGIGGNQGGNGGNQGGIGGNQGGIGGNQGGIGGNNGENGGQGGIGGGTGGIGGGTGGMGGGGMGGGGGGGMGGGGGRAEGTGKKILFLL